MAISEVRIQMTKHVVLRLNATEMETLREVLYDRAPWLSKEHDEWDAYRFPVNLERWVARPREQFGYQGLTPGQTEVFIVLRRLFPEVPLPEDGDTCNLKTNGGSHWGPMTLEFNWTESTRAETRHAQVER